MLTWRCTCSSIPAAKRHMPSRWMFMFMCQVHPGVRGKHHANPGGDMETPPLDHFALDAAAYGLTVCLGAAALPGSQSPCGWQCGTASSHAGCEHGARHLGYQPAAAGEAAAAAAIVQTVNSGGAVCPPCRLTRQSHACKSMWSLHAF